MTPSPSWQAAFIASGAIELATATTGLVYRTGEDVMVARTTGWVRAECAVPWKQRHPQQTHTQQHTHMTAHTV